jgi:GSH-dependent disulfide-bond oxidoreductase
VRFQFAAPDGLDYAVNRYRREAERHYRVLDSQLAGRDYIVGSDYTIVDMSAWGWIDRASRVMKGADDPLAPFPKRQTVVHRDRRAPRGREGARSERITSSRR